MAVSAQLTRVRLQKGQHLVKRGEVWYLETCSNARQRRRSLGTSDLEEATRLAATASDVEFRSSRHRSSRSKSPDISSMDITTVEDDSAVSLSSQAPLQPSVFLIMLAMGRGRAHGYSIMQELDRMSGGTLRMGPGTLYRCLVRMVADGLVEEIRERDQGSDSRRRYYRLTKRGFLVGRQETSRLRMILRAAKVRGIA